MAGPSMIGRTLGGFSVEREIGRGGMGEVLLARQDTLGRPAVLKRILRDLANQPELAERFQREARSAGAIHHQNVVAVYDLFTHRGAHYLAQEYVDGADLASVLLIEAPLPWRIAALIALEIARGLEAVHAVGTLHRDLKPANLLLGRRGQVKISDFGLALDVESSSLTLPGVALGTPDYMAPEQLRCERVDARTDVFAFGCVVYEMLTGVPPFSLRAVRARGGDEDEEGEPHDTIAERIARGRFRPVRRADRRIPRALARMVERCLRAKPKRRAASARELRRQLEALLGTPLARRLPGRARALGLGTRPVRAALRRDRRADRRAGERGAPATARTAVGRGDRRGRDGPRDRTRDVAAAARDAVDGPSARDRATSGRPRRRRAARVRATLSPRALDRWGTVRACEAAPASPSRRAHESGRSGMDRLEGRTAVVTGGGSGIGRGIALALASEGMNVVVADLQSESAEAVASEVMQAGARAIAVQCDVTSDGSLASAASAAADAFGPVHVLSNNAGVIVETGPISDRTMADWEYVFSVNLFGIVRSVGAFLPGMQAHGEGGHIVNTASMAALISQPRHGIAIYGASKYACLAYCEYLRAELEPFGIGVSALCPGMIESNLSATSAANRPAAYGGPEPPPAIDGIRKEHAPPGAVVLSGEECGRIVVGGIRENRLHIVTHTESLPLVEQRFEAIRADYAAEVAARQARS